MDADCIYCELLTTEGERIIELEFELGMERIESNYLRRKLEINDEFEPRIKLAMALCAGSFGVLIGVLIGMALLIMRSGA